MTSEHSPFHPGELEAQRRAGAGDVASWAGGFIRDHMPDQHRAFFASLPFLVIAGGDGDGWPWVTIVEGPAGFVSTPDKRRLSVAARLPPQDPLSATLVPGAKIGALGIELATRRRNRLNGLIRADDAGFAIEVRQSFGNCPQYIHERVWHRAEPATEASARLSRRLDPGQQARITAADTFFIGSGYSAGGDRPSDGYDASHRGGAPGFVRVMGGGTVLRIPDYAGNNYFNTIGNLVSDPRVGLLFVDFATGGLLHVAGRARIDWAPRDSHDPNARRMIEVAVEKVIDRPGALTLRWRDEGDMLQQLRVIGKETESDRITSFHLAAADGTALPPFAAGQHLPVELDVPGQPQRVGRSYSLSGSPLGGTYRISVKREDHGIASTFLHSATGIGDTITARQPAGDFTLPGGDGALVLVSAGVGVTPMLSMLQAVVASPSSRPVWFVHGARDRQSHAFRAEVDALIRQRANITRKVFYSAPRESDRKGADFDVAGRVSEQHLLALGAGTQAHYMLCGPARFLADLRAGLEAGNVPPDHIHFETFGPSG
ncbi:pyridoxamine 5'-phosphate oxidase family protein [Halodurantibacterium flavum]|uniref:Pyridoxamine 5'-phosphate oxidase family protein n=1 Tax=Halodurantibacterium flavum TaxID=1382802 RepID=A0ABW4RZJ8_9RHOB